MHFLQIPGLCLPITRTDGPVEHRVTTRIRQVAATQDFFKHGYTIVCRKPMFD